MYSVRRRFGRGLRNLFHVYRDLCDAMVILDNSGDRPRLRARIVGARVEVTDASGYARIVKEADTWP
ncbi:MAG TPA: hypothetical protein DCM87_02050 [Planctomycetes bacterium]|nr:hypothetical protein [Planctomycetota bacterium]